MRKLSGKIIDVIPNILYISRNKVEEFLQRVKQLRQEKVYLHRLVLKAYTRKMRMRVKRALLLLLLLRKTRPFLASECRPFSVQCFLNLPYGVRLCVESGFPSTVPANILVFSFVIRYACGIRFYARNTPAELIRELLIGKYGKSFLYTSSYTYM